MNNSVTRAGLVVKEFLERCQSNKIIAVRGMPGSGKTTLARLIGTPLELDEIALTKFIIESDNLAEITGKPFNPQTDDPRSYLFEHCLSSPKVYERFIRESNKFLIENFADEFEKVSKNNGTIALDYSLLPNEISQFAHIVVDVSATEHARKDAFCSREEDILLPNELEQKYNIIQSVELPLFNKLTPATLTFDNEHGNHEKMNKWINDELTI